MSYKQSYSKTPINFKDDPEQLTGSLGDARNQSAFREVIKEKGLKESISNPRTTVKEIKQTRIDRLKATQAAKPKQEKTFYQIEKTKNKFEDIDGVRTLVDPAHYERFGTKSLNLDKGNRNEVAGTRERLTKKETKTYLKSTFSKDESLYRQMRNAVKEAKPSFKGKDAPKARKAAWKDKAGGTGGKKNAIKNKFGFGFVPQQGAQPGLGGKIEGSGNMSNTTGRSQGGVCTQAKMLSGGCK